MKGIVYTPDSTVYAGVPPFNVSLASTDDGLAVIPVIFMLFTPNFLSDTIQVFQYSEGSLPCEDDEICFSYVVPASLQSLAIPDYDDFFGTNITTYTIVNATAYMLDYRLQEGTNIVYAASDCRVLGLEGTIAVKICSKNVDEYLVAGNTPLVTER